MLAQKAARVVIELTQSTPLRGKGNYTQLGNAEVAAGDVAYPQAREELNRFWDFFEFHDKEWTRQLVEGKDLVDLGFGYGGRSVGWARFFNPRTVIGIEVYPNLIPMAEAFAQSEEEERCQFLLGEQESIPLDDSSADVLVSYDVLEHVDDPQKTLREIHRVLRPGGYALIVFTPYHGLVAHHLGYITRVPGIHWLFRPMPLVAAINDVLAKDSTFNTNLQPAPRPSHNGKRLCLPGLNGLTSDEFIAMLDGFDIRQLRQTPILSHYRVLGRVGEKMNRLMMKVSRPVRDGLSYNLSCVLQKNVLASRAVSPA